MLWNLLNLQTLNLEPLNLETLDSTYTFTTKLYIILIIEIIENYKQKEFEIIIQLYLPRNKMEIISRNLKILLNY